jgi:hypothetical protein
MLIADTPEVRAHDLPDPYEPLIRLFEGGSTLEIDQGMLILLYMGLDHGVVSTSLNRYDGAEPFAYL